ncbi:MAG: DEAD/DEAH box helicase [Nanoarchaeota archaeon]|nr:DEAD/DEAH box helicase [Nanoarchaeota archaeon]
MIKNFKPRIYQEAILNTAALKNTLVVLPTGLGKTLVFLMLAALRIQHYPKSKILLVGPTKPLIDQYFSTFKEHLEIDEKDMAIFTGEVKPADRIELWKKSKIIFSTPQSIENDILSNRISLEDVSLLGIDEAHRAVSNYSYVWVTKQYNKTAKYPRILGLTASPGSDMEKITEVCKNLFIEEIEVRTENDSDVKPYVQETEILWVEVELPKELKNVKVYFDRAVKERLTKLKSWGILQKPISYVSKTELLRMQAYLHKDAVSAGNDNNLWQSISIVAEIIKLLHASELLESQGLSPLYEYCSKIVSSSATSKVRAVKNVVQDPNFKAAYILIQTLKEQSFMHPKLEKLKDIVLRNSKKPNEKTIVFTQYRDSGVKITKELNKINNIHAELFVGQQKKGNTGMSQKKQKEMLDKFRASEFNILVATSIAEEGLDIPKVSNVIFYEPVPSAIRHIQRRGRTGRQEKGHVLILMTKGTRDEAFKWGAHHKQKRMYRTLENIKNSVNSPIKKAEINPNKDLKEFMKNEILIFIDQRERSSDIARALKDKGVTIKVEQLKAGDIVCSDNVAVELKKVDDFVNSIIDGRLLEQMKKLKENYKCPLLIIEGTQDIYTVRRMHPHAIQGMLATITVNYGIPILYTKNAEETASILYIIAKREQENSKNYFSPHFNKQNLSLKEHQEYIVSSLPNIGPVAAKELLKKFGNVKDIINADEKELIKVENIAKTKAKRLREVLDSNYEK